MTFIEILKKFREESLTEKEKGTKFEQLMRGWLQTDPKYNLLKKVWLWEEFPCRENFGGKETGIDLVALTETGDYWAIQCKCYAADTTIDKPAVDSFLATSSRTFPHPETMQTTRFALRLWISTTNNWGKNALEAFENQQPPVQRIDIKDLVESSVDWDKLLKGITGDKARSKPKQLFGHQQEAIDNAREYYLNQGATRGKLIMACGTGKTFTSLRLVEDLTGGRGLVLFMVPSIALLGQSLNAWFADAQRPIKAVCICSDNKASRQQTNRFDELQDSVIDLALPASTDPQSITRQMLAYRHHEGLVVVFSTYQSIDAVSAAQRRILQQTQGEYGVFDFIVCDEAHRTTGVKLSDRDESNFIKIHSDENIQGRRRLYMTATPRLYGQSAKIKASQRDCILCSMDDKGIYGEEFHRVNFSYAVQNGLLTDYKVLVLTVNETNIPQNLQNEIRNRETELNYDEVSRLIGVINGLSKNIHGDQQRTWNNDPCMMRRAVAFCSSIGSETKAGSSKYVTAMLPHVSEMYNEQLTEAERSHVVCITTRHIDGSMNSMQRNDVLQWLAEETQEERECRVVCNVRCLSEGVDVPSLDAVLFLSPRNSQVDVVQSVGRVMRNFRKGQSGEKRYGYIIIPIVVPADVKAEDALNNNKSFDVVWSILNALRSHDDSFNAEVNKLALNDNKASKVSIVMPGLNVPVDNPQDRQDAVDLDNDEVARQLDLRFGNLQQAIYAKLVEKCGDRLYWENWAKEIGDIAKKFTERIERLIKTGAHREAFGHYLCGLQRDLNPAVDATQAIELLAQHMITRPVFDALFAEYQFVNNNAVSRSIQRMLDLLREEAFEKDTEVLERFYESVRINVADIDNLRGKQEIIKNLYEKFFKGAFPLTVEKLGIVYTPVPCVDFILRSVDYLLREEFQTSLSAENVHILDPFVGTGTFITRLLQSGLIRREDMERKYLHEIHCNEIVLLAYYVADVNIESVYQDLMKPDKYLPYNGICLTDTFQLSEPQHNDLFTEFFQENTDRVKEQKKTPVRVIIGNPPYSVGQRDANDNAQNLSYPILDGRVAETYAAATRATNKNSLYDSYIKAFRWASDRISTEEGGIVAFISNGAWLDGNAQDGFRRCLEQEFTSIYVLNLRGNARTSGEQRRKEGGGIFDAGSRTPIAITFLVRNPQKTGKKAEIHYHDIGDYLDREQKLRLVSDFRYIGSSQIEWQKLTPNEKADWINQRDGAFDSLIPIAPEQKFNVEAQAFFAIHTRGNETGRDAWMYNFSTEEAKANAKRFIEEFNRNIGKTSADDLNRDTTLISWTRNLESRVLKGEMISYSDSFDYGLYRPFNKQVTYRGEALVNFRGQIDKIFPTPQTENLVICVSSVGDNHFSVLMTDCVPDLHLIATTQCFPLHWYEEKKEAEGTLFGSENVHYVCRDGVTDWILREVRSRYRVGREIGKEEIFYYVYGLLHSPQYRTRFVDDLRKSLPRIPIVESVEQFMAFSRAGRQLAALHLGYEQVPPCPDVEIVGTHGDASDSNETYRVEKMRFRKVRNEAGKLVDDRTCIVYNSMITIDHIPQEAYRYVVNGKSAIEWIMERYAVTTDKASLIKNDPNLWSREQGKPRYILDLLLSVINLSVQTVRIVEGLPADVQLCYNP